MSDDKEYIIKLTEQDIKDLEYDINFDVYPYTVHFDYDKLWNQIKKQSEEEDNE